MIRDKNKLFSEKDKKRYQSHQRDFIQMKMVMFKKVK